MPVRVSAQVSNKTIQNPLLTSKTRVSRDGAEVRLYCLNVWNFATGKGSGEKVIGELAVFEAKESGDNGFIQFAGDPTKRK